MTIRSSPWPAGTPCWTDLAVPDVAAATAFYGPVLGWTFTPAADAYGGYVTALRGDAPVAGLTPLRGPEASVWSLYFASDDAEATLAAVSAHGGTVVLPATAVGDMGRMAMAADPTGAVFGLWQAGAQIGAALVNEPGGIVWEDLRSSDAVAARDFYAGVFGFEMRPLEMAGPGYWTFHHPGDDAPLGGLGGLMGETGASRWIVYFSVAATDEALARAEAAGGTVLRPAMDTPFGRMAELADPFGARFMVAQATGQAQPDRSG